MLTILDGSPKKLERLPIGGINLETGDFDLPVVQSPQSMLVSGVAASSPTVGISPASTRDPFKPPLKSDSQAQPQVMDSVVAARAKAGGIGPPPKRSFSVAATPASPGFSSPTASSKLGYPHCLTYYHVMVCILHISPYPHTVFPILIPLYPTVFPILIPLYPTVFPFLIPLYSPYCIPLSNPPVSP